MIIAIVDGVDREVTPSDVSKFDKNGNEIWYVVLEDNSVTQYYYNKAGLLEKEKDSYGDSVKYTYKCWYEQ